MWVSLNDEGKKVWGDIFPDGQVPVCSFFGESELEGLGKEEVALISWKGLSFAQQASILKKISQLSHVPENIIKAEILKKGLPLRKSLTTGIVAMELKYFI